MDFELKQPERMLVEAKVPETWECCERRPNAAAESLLFIQNTSNAAKAAWRSAISDMRLAIGVECLFHDQPIFPVVIVALPNIHGAIALFFIERDGAVIGHAHGQFDARHFCLFL